MAKALHKVHKQISKKKGGKLSALHENSRDAKRLRRASAREEKLARLMRATSKANQHYVDRIAWFQDQLRQDPTDSVSDSALHQLVDMYINRRRGELEHLKAERRPGRPPSKDEERLQRRLDEDGKEFDSGIWVPNLTSMQCIESLHAWDGEWDSLNTLTFVRVARDGQHIPSNFPPKANS